MVVVHARFRLRAGAAPAFEVLRGPMVAATRAEPGCEAYAAHRGTEDPDEVTFVETWTTRAALEAHFGTRHFRAFVAAMEPLTVGAPEVHVFHVARTERL